MCAILTYFRRSKISIANENTKPMDAANFLGAAKTGFGFNFSSLEVIFAIKAKGEVRYVNARKLKSTTKIPAIYTP